MNIAILVPRFPPSSVGGAQMQAQAWARNLGTRHRVTVITGAVDSLPPTEERDHFGIVRPPRWKPDLLLGAPQRLPRNLRGRGLGKPVNLFKRMVDIHGLVRSVRSVVPRPDVLVCFMTITGRVGVRVGRILGIPTVVWIRGESDYRLSESEERRRVSTRVWARASMVLVQSEGAVADLLGELAAVSPELVPVVREKLAVVENGVDLPALSEFHVDGPVLSVGRLVPEKSMDVVIDACAAAGRSLVIAGDGPERSVLQERADAIRAEVRFTGFVGGDELDDLYRRASVAVLASRSEGMPNAILEAMAYGLPVVATPVGAIPELLVDGVNGLVVPVGDTEALAVALRRLAADPDLARRLGSAARATVERFGWDQVIPKLERILGC